LLLDTGDDRQNLTLREIQFIGRESELADLAGALQGALQGRGAVALLAGEPGIGKTRLADELAKTALGREATSAWGRCWEAGGTPAYWPWTQILRELVATRGPPTLERDAGDMVDLATLVPELAASQRGMPDIADPVQARFRLFDAVGRFLRALSVERPIVVVLDDLHSADLSSLHLLHFVARELRSMRVLVIGTYREAEARASAERMDLITRVAREGAVFPLTRLDSASVAMLVRSELGGETDEELVRTLQRSSEGNPLFLSEMLRLMRSSPVPFAKRHIVPDTVNELLRTRLALMDEPTRHVVEFAAVFGREFTEPQLARVAHLARPSLRERLDNAAGAGLVDEGRNERWSFSHILIREALYASIPVALRARLHAELAADLEAGMDDSSSSLSAIAHHRLLGAAESGARHAVESALTLSRRALRMFAFEDVVAVLERALGLLETEPDALELRSSVLTVLGEVYIRLDQGEKGRQACRAAAELARTRGDIEGLARAALAYGNEITPGEVDPVLVRLLEEALEALVPSFVGLRARVSARLAAARQPAPDTTGPIILAREAIELARSTGDDETLRTTIHFALGALVDYAEPDEIVRLCQEAIALATAAGDKTQLLRAHGRMVFASLELADIVRADAAIAAYELLTRELPAHYRSDALMMRAMRALMSARFSEVDELVLLARELRDPSTNPFARAGALFHDMARDLVQERAERIVAKEAEASEVFSIIPERMGIDYVHALSACARARLGDHDAARRHLDAIADDSAIITEEPQGQRVFAEAVAAVGDARRAALIEPRLAKRSRQVMTWGRMVMVCDAPVSWLLGLLAEAQGRTEDAKKLLGDAVERAREMGHVSILPRLRLDLGRTLSHGAGLGDPDNAVSVIAEARAEAERLGYHALAQSAAELGARLADSASTTTPGHRSAHKDAAPDHAIKAFSLAPEGEYYSVEYGSEVIRLKDSLGLRLLKRLVSNPEREYHVLELVGANAAHVDTGDSGEMLDAHAVDEYRRRLEDLREAAREAEAFGDTERRSRAEAEIDSLGDELARGVGLGGRGRRAGAASERARINVQRRLRDAIRRIGDQLPDLGRHLSWAVKTGVFCVYTPGRRS
jgi:tetratricopeptide (TPR) repeat protein